MRRGLLLAAVALAVLATPALARASGNEPVYNEQGQLVETPLTPSAPKSLLKLNDKQALALFEANPKVAKWLARYPRAQYAIAPTNATYDAKTGIWTIQIFYKPAGEIATGKVVDETKEVTEAWTGPQVAWTMARCNAGWNITKPGCGAFGGNLINSPWLWILFLAIFVVGLLDFSRLLSIRTLDLLMLALPISASLWFFNNGHIFASGSLYTPTLVYLLGRMLWIGYHGRPVRAQPTWPTWVLVALAVFLGGFRIGLNVLHGNVIDVGYSGIIGAQRIVHDHQAPYGHFPNDTTTLTPCGLADSAGNIRRRIQTNGRCEDANPLGDTYGPVAYEAYIPGYLLFGWSGKWDKLPASRFTSILFDLLCVLGLVLVGKRFGGYRLAAILAFAWMAYPFTQYVSSANTNDSIPAAFLLFGIWLMHKPAARGFFGALAGWTKFAPLLVLALWLGHPQGLRSRRKLDYVAGIVIATGAAFSVFLLEPSFTHELRVFWDRTVAWQVKRDAPFSIWDWRQYHAGLPNLHLVQRALQVGLIVLALALAVVPRRRSPLQLVAFTAALLVGFELVLTYWLYTYVAWFFPIVAIALLATAETAPPQEGGETVEGATEEPVGAV